MFYIGNLDEVELEDRTNKYKLERSSEAVMGRSIAVRHSSTVPVCGLHGQLFYL